MTSPTTQLGNLGQLAVATEATARGYHVSIPLEGADYDLVIDKHGKLHRVQVKCTTLKANGSVSMAVNAKTEDCFDALVVYERAQRKIYWIDMSEVTNRNCVSLRLHPPKNNQTKRTRLAADYETW